MMTMLAIKKKKDIKFRARDQLCIKAAVIKCQELSDLNNRSLSFPRLEVQHQGLSRVGSSPGL